MVRLKNRQTGIPNGYQFYLPNGKWSPRPHSSFQGIVEGLTMYLQGNPNILKQLGWKLEKNFLGDKVDEYNAKLCEKMGWTEYITEVSETAGGQSGRPFPSQSVAQGGGDVRPPKKRCCGRR